MRAVALVSLLSLLVGTGCAPTKVAELPKVANVEVRAPLDEGEQRRAYEAGRYAEVEARLQKADSESSRLLLAEVYFATGRGAAALRLLGGRTDPAGALLAARVTRALGDREKALRILGDAKPKTPAIELAYAEFEREKGGGDSALLERLANDEKEAPFVRGRAYELLGKPKEANEFYNRAEETGGLELELALRRAALFLEKYDTAHAAEVVREAEARYPNRAELLALEAEIVLRDALDFVNASRLAERALAIDPENAAARSALVEVALRDEEIDLALGVIAKGLAVRPLDQKLHAQRATAHFLRGESEALERELDWLDVNFPRDARNYVPLAELAEWEHRYAELDGILRRAVRRDRKNGGLRGRLGLNLLRFGDESEALVELRESFRLDPFDVRVKNTLDLFEESVKKKYVELRRDRFVYRFPREESALLERYVPDLASAAIARYDEFYGTKVPRIQIELYATKQEFSVRTSGLPQIGIAGVCFGRKLASVTPRGSRANLGMTLWHELAHVYHLEVSKSRVPRYLTEGLAEWETRRLARGWSRELDLELFESLREKTLPPLARFNHAFSRATSMKDIAVAYYASERLVDFLAKTRGEAALPEILRQIGAGKSFTASLGEGLERTDHDFFATLEKEVARFSGQIVLATARGTPEEIALRGSAKDASPRARLHALSVGGESLERLEELFTETQDPEVGLVFGRALLRAGDSLRASNLLPYVVSKGARGVELSLALAQLSLSLGEFAEVGKFAREAIELDPDSAEAYSFLAASALEAGNKKDELAAVLEVARLSEHNFTAHERVLELVLDLGEFKGAEQLAENAVWAGLGRCETHTLAANVFAKVGARKRADFERETKRLVCPPTKL